MQLWSDSGRFQLFGESPIIAGCVFGALAPWVHLFLLGGRKWNVLRLILMLVFEFLAVGACVLTQSRGPLIAIIISNIIGCFLYRRFTDHKTVLYGSLWSACSAVFLPLVTGMGKRIAYAV